MIWVSLVPFGYAMFLMVLGSLTPFEFDTDWVSITIALALFLGLFFGKDFLMDKWRNDFRVYDELQLKGEENEVRN